MMDNGEKRLNQPTVLPKVAFTPEWSLLSWVQFTRDLWGKCFLSMLSLLRFFARNRAAMLTVLRLSKESMCTQIAQTINDLSASVRTVKYLVRPYLTKHKFSIRGSIFRRL